MRVTTLIIHYYEGHYAHNSVVECYTSNVDTRVRFPLGVNSLVLLQKEPGGGEQSSYYTGLAQSVERGPFSRG